MKLRFEIGPDDLTWSDMDELEEARDSGKLRGVRRIMARFMVDESGQPLTHEAAMAALGALKISQIRQAAEAFADELRRQQKSEVPPDS